MLRKKKSDNFKVGNSVALGIICPSDLTVQCQKDDGTIVNFVAPEVTGGTAPYTIVCTADFGPGHEADPVASGDRFPCGTTTITCTVTDDAGETATCQFTITVHDTTKPIIVCEGTLSGTATTPAGVVIPLVPPTATDNCDLNPTVTGSRSDGLPLTDPFPCCLTTITWTATDACGNSEICEQLVAVTCVFTPGGRTLGFWSNKNGQALENASDLCDLGSLNLRTGTGANFDPLANCLTPTPAQVSSGKTALNSWLLNATATSMAYMFSAQLAATELSVRHGFTDPSVIVDGARNIYEEIAYANALLANPIAGVVAPYDGLNGSLTKTASALRTEQERVKNILDKINNGGSFVQPCQE